MNSLRLKTVCLLSLFWGFLFVSGCTSAQEKCLALREEVKGLYNDYVDEISALTKSQIMAHCDQVIEKCPALALAYELKGLIQWDNDNLKGAFRNYRKAVELEPGSRDTLDNAGMVAFLAEGVFISVGEDGRIASIPFPEITLGQYAECSDELRELWCEKSFNRLPRKRKTVTLVDQSGNEVDTMEFGYTYRIDSAEDLDGILLRMAEEESGTLLHKATFLATMSGADYGRTD